jgi:hypothetical protein
MNPVALECNGGKDRNSPKIIPELVVSYEK